MEVIFILVIVFIIVIYGLLAAMSKVIEAGGNPSHLLSTIGRTKKKEPDSIQLPESKRKTLSNYCRTTLGLLLGLLLITPGIFGTPRGGGKPILDIPIQWRTPSYIALLFITIVFFIVTWKVDRIYQGKGNKKE